MAWYADERFWRIARPWLFADPFWIVAPYEVESILSMTNRSATCRVLDLACGPGRVALQFAKRGAKVTGVDLNQPYLDLANEMATRVNLDVEWICADMRDYRVDAMFDIAVCLYNSFGYFADEAADARVLKNVCDSLAPGGHFVLDHLGRELCEYAIGLQPYQETRGGLTVEHRAELRGDNSILHCEWNVTGDGVHERFVTEQNVYGANELMQLARRAGFNAAECFGGYERGAYTRESDRLLLVATK